MSNILNRNSTTQFVATLSSAASNVTGDGTVYTCVWDTSSGSGYNTSTGIFTAPQTGDYLFIINLYFSGLTLSMTICSNLLITTSGTYQFGLLSCAGGKSAANTFLLPPGIIPVTMSSGDTAYVTSQISNGGKSATFDTLSMFSAVRLL